MGRLMGKERIRIGRILIGGGAVVNLMPERAARQLRLNLLNKDDIRQPLKLEQSTFGAILQE